MRARCGRGRPHSTLGTLVALQSGMAEPENEERAERRVVVESVTSTTTRNSAVAWIIIGVLAIALIVYILIRII